MTRHGYGYYRTSRRLLALKFADGGARLYNLRLPAREHHEDGPNHHMVVEIIARAGRRSTGQVKRAVMVS